MSEWEFESIYPSGEKPSPRTGYKWKYHGEITLSLFLGSSDSGPRYEVARILEHPEAARGLVSVIEREKAIERTSNGEVFVDEPYWHGYTPNQLRGFCREFRLPLPEGYARNWRAIRYQTDSRR